MIEDIISTIITALNEDIGTGDITTEATIPDNVLGKGIFLVKDEGIIAGIDVAEQVFKTVDKGLVFLKSRKMGIWLKMEILSQLLKEVPLLF